MKVRCHTNLDLVNAEYWPTELPAVPMVGDLITSGYTHSGGFKLDLQVVCITWEPIPGDYPGSLQWYPVIELHMTDFQRRMPPKDNHGGKVADGSITAFYQWYAPLVGRSVGSFI